MKKNQNETIEFFNPEDGLEIDYYIRNNIKQGIHHLARYYWATDVCKQFKSKKILDIACGAGYGSYILGKALPNAEITGADYDLRAISYAKDAYILDNIHFVNGDIEKWLIYEDEEVSIPLGEFDCITSFDTIEHLLHRDMALIRITQNLTPKGMLLLSTPCSHSESRLNPGWEHHKLEYSFKDLYYILSLFFKTVYIPQNPYFPNIEYWNNVVNKEKTLYPNITNPVVCLGPNKVI